MSATDTEWRILDLLMEDERPRSVAEIVQAIGRPAAVAEALDGLHAAGLISRSGECVSLATGPPQASGRGVSR